VSYDPQLYDSRVTELESALESAESKRGEEVALLENELQAARQVRLRQWTTEGNRRWRTSCRRRGWW
jgi:hypothetical protein